MYIKEHLWEDAFLVIKRHKEFTEEVQGSYAHWLADNDRFDEARVAFLAAGQPEKSTDLLQVSIASKKLCSEAIIIYASTAWESAQFNPTLLLQLTCFCIVLILHL